MPRSKCGLSDETGNANAALLFQLSLATFLPSRHCWHGDQEDIRRKRESDWRVISSTAVDVSFASVGSPSLLPF